MKNQTKVTPLQLDDGSVAYTRNQPESFGRAGEYRPAYVEFFLNEEATQFWGTVTAHRMDACFDHRLLSLGESAEFKKDAAYMPLSQQSWWLGDFERQADHPKGIKLSAALGAWLRSRPAILENAQKVYLSTNTQYFSTTSIRSKLKALLAVALGAHQVPGSDSVLELDLDQQDATEVNIAIG